MLAVLLMTISLGALTSPALALRPEIDHEQQQQQMMQPPGKSTSDGQCPPCKLDGAAMVPCQGSGWTCPYKTKVKGSKVIWPDEAAAERQKNNMVTVEQNCNWKDYTEVSKGRIKGRCCVKAYCEYTPTKYQEACEDKKGEVYDICVDDGLTLSDIKYRCPQGRESLKRGTCSDPSLSSKGAKACNEAGKTWTKGAAAWGIHPDVWLPFGGNKNGMCCTTKCVHGKHTAK